MTFASDFHNVVHTPITEVIATNGTPIVCQLTFDFNRSNALFVGKNFKISADQFGYCQCQTVASFESHNQQNAFTTRQMRGRQTRRFSWSFGKEVTLCKRVESTSGLVERRLPIGELFANSRIDYIPTTSH